MELEMFKVLEEESILDEKKAISFIKNHNTRNFFINNYGYFRSDENFEAYILYIKSRIKNKVSNLEIIDLIDLSINLEYFNNHFFNLIKGFLLEKRNYLLKLSILDYMNMFFHENAVNKNYLDTNRLLYKKTSNNLVKFQSCINLLLSNDVFYKKKIESKLKKSNTPSFYYYRYVTTLTDFKQFFEYKDVILIDKIIQESHSLSSSNKIELIKLLDSH